MLEGEQVVHVERRVFENLPAMKPSCYRFHKHNNPTSSIPRPLADRARLPPRLSTSPSSTLSGRSSRPTGNAFNQSSPIVQKPFPKLAPLAPPPSSSKPSTSPLQPKAPPKEKKELFTLDSLQKKTQKLDRPLQNAEIPSGMYARFILPPTAMPSTPVPFYSVWEKEDVQALLKNTGDLVLVKIGETLSAPSSEEDSLDKYSIIRYTPRPSSPLSSVSSSPKASSIGPNSGLRNAGMEKDLLVSWVSSANDIAHKVAQAEAYLKDAYRVTVEFGPKKKRGGKDPKPPLTVMQAMLDEVADALRDVAERWKEDRIELKANRGWM